MSIKRIVSFVIIFSIVLCSSITLSGAALLTESEEKVFCNASLADDFADNQVIVIMKNTASLKFNEYTAADFPEISCSKVVDLMPSMTKSAQSIVFQTEAANMRGTNSIDNISDLGYKIDLNDYHQTLCLEIANPGKQNVLAAVKALEARSDILCAEPNYRITFDAVTINDQYFGQQWAANKINLQQAWNITTGSSSVRVGILDTSIDSSHPDLASRINVYMSRDCRSGTAVPVQNLSQTNPHGTLVAGVIGAAGNSIGISGVCRNVSLVSLQIGESVNENSYEETYAFMSGVAAAIDYAAGTLDDNISSNDIRILNCSFGTYGGYNSYLMRNAIEDYGELGGLVVCSAGNKGANTDYGSHYPSKYAEDHDYVIAVGASTSTDAKWASSNYGAYSVDVFAPGDNILSCYPTDICNSMGIDCIEGHYSTGYHSVSGTSVAAPHVAGVAALMLAINPNLTAANIKEIIINNADDLNAFNGFCVSGGRLNAYAAVAACLHTHRFSYIETATTHSGTCACGYTVVEPHTWAFMNNGTRICTKCAYIPANEEIMSTINSETR